MQVSNIISTEDIWRDGDPLLISWIFFYGWDNEDVSYHYLL